MVKHSSDTITVAVVKNVLLWNILNKNLSFGFGETLCFDIGMMGKFFRKFGFLGVKSAVTKNTTSFID